ncbi:hypothetical protein BT96DRAFT_997964 [Gymnopus androsaceus JB14]|uniref:Uncharacterized protein n=1 Tax=Gymnopus androsaceus JB14 TaxID=1447944 RepID=A0A6A4H9W0_9AGAR|nr:hypothetical protein BT96DRAFT_997964 [Gymnopus androsaceus JB14]
MAEIQITSLFVSSPPFPTDLPSDDGRFASMCSISSSILFSQRKTTSDEGYAASNATTDEGSGSGKRLAPNGKALFKARTLPSTHERPDIVPLLGNLRRKLANTFANVSGHKRAETIAVASTAAPTIAPRLTKVAALRLGVALPPPPTVRKQPSGSFEGVPGHKDQTKDNAPPTSFMFRGPSEPKLPGGRSNSRLSVNESSTSSNAKPSRPSSAASSRPSARPPSVTRQSLAPAPARASTSSRTNSNANAATNGRPTSSAKGTPSASAARSPAPEVAEKPKLTRRPSSVSLPLSIAPRTNNSAALRAAKKEQEAAATAALAAKQQRRASRPPPSSMPKGLLV